MEDRCIPLDTIGIVVLENIITIRSYRTRWIACLLWSIALFLMGAGAARALEPGQVMVIANRKAAQSIGLAHYYMKRRGIPKENLVVIWVTNRETCSREDYERRIAAPVRRALIKASNRKAHIRCLVTMRGVPLRVRPPELTSAERDKKAAIKKELAAIKNALLKAKKGSKKAVRLKKELEARRKALKGLSKKDQGAAVDSELSLVLEPKYPLAGWIPNPMFVGFRGRTNKMHLPKTVLMVSRLDGPSPSIVKRLVDDAVAVEKKGLSGTAYFDARWPKPRPEKTRKLRGGYALYDASIHLAAEAVKRSGRMHVVVDSRQALFQPGQCPNAALYCGWYSLAHYVPAFTWVRGAIGYHIASSECSTLRAGSSQVWCKRMLEEGVAATIGPVGEPYVQAFPVPHLFFTFLLRGATLVEAAYLSMPFVSWRMVIVGDPLYRPFGVGVLFSS